MLPVWDWHPVFAGLLLFGVDFGAVMLIRIAIERKLYLTRWWSFRLGDSVFLSLYGVFAAITIRGEDITGGFQAQVWWHLTLVAIGCMIWWIIESVSVRNRDPQITGLPSNLWHIYAAGFMFYLVAWSIVFILIEAPDRPAWAITACLVCLTGYIGTVAYDNLLGDRSPETLVNGIRR